MNALLGAIGMVALIMLLGAKGQPSSFPPKCRGISRGKDFVLAFTSNLQHNVGELHILVVAFSNNPTTVTISSKHQINGANYQTTFEIHARGFRRTTIPYDFLLQPISGRSDNVLRVTASSDVSVYGMNYEPFSTDAFLALPNIQLGTHYIATSIRTTQTGSKSSVISVVGVEDNTEVHITLTSSVRFNDETYNRGDILSFIVNSDEAAQVLGSQGADLSGSIIRASSPVVAYSGHECASTAGSYCDILSEQLIPVKSWGSTHIYTATGSEDDTSIFRIFAFFDGTTISVPGYENRTLNSGEFWQVTLRGNGVISSNFPSKVVQFIRFVSGSLVDPSIIQVPSIEQFSFLFGFTTPPKSGGDGSGFFNFVNIVVKADECDTVTINGELLQCNNTASPVPGTNYVALTQQLPKGEGVYFIEQSSHESISPMSVIVYGYEDDETYGYAAGLSLPSESRLLSIKPFVVRECGCDVITATLPCLQQNIPKKGDVLCRYQQKLSDAETVVDGILTDFYEVICPTPPFTTVGMTDVAVSIDGGENYAYSDSTYVAQQEVVLPKVSIDGLESDYQVIDLTEESSGVSLRWDPMDIPYAKHIQLSVAIAMDDKEKGCPVWQFEMFLKGGIKNTGQFKIGAQLVQLLKKDKRLKTALTAMFYVKNDFLDGFDVVVDNINTHFENYRKEFVEGLRTVQDTITDIIDSDFIDSTVQKFDSTKETISKGFENYKLNFLEGLDTAGKFFGLQKIDKTLGKSSKGTFLEGLKLMKNKANDNLNNYKRDFEEGLNVLIEEYSEIYDRFLGDLETFRKATSEIVSRFIEDLAEGVSALKDLPTLASRKAIIVLFMLHSDVFDVGECKDWCEYLDRPLGPLPPCPCTFREADDDDRYTRSDHDLEYFHEGAKSCFRANAEGSPAGQQCCYGKNGQLRLGTKENGGTADAYAPSSLTGKAKHLFHDVFPWLACCKFSSDPEDCEKYYKFRPSDDCSTYIDPNLATAFGDPHIITLDQKAYTFNAIGEFTLLESTVHDVIFQGRMERFLTTNASVFTAFALVSNSAPIIQVQRSALGEIIILLNGTRIEVTHENKTIPRFDFDGFAINLNVDLTTINIRYHFGLTIKINILPYLMSYTVFLPDQFKSRVRGLLGNFNDDQEDDFLLPNGDIVPSDSTVEEIHTKFGLKWAIVESSSLFTYLPPTDYFFYNNVTFVPNFQVPNRSEVSKEVQDLCGTNDACLFDAVSTGDISFANHTLFHVQVYYEMRDTLAEIVICKFPEIFKNGKLDGGVYYVDSTYKVKCLDGYLLFGSDSNYCQVDGKWSVEFPSCISYWVVFGLPAGVLCILILLIIVIVVIKRKFCRKGVKA